jgi:hypothetical protein
MSFTELRSAPHANALVVVMRDRSRRRAAEWIRLGQDERPIRERVARTPADSSSNDDVLAVPLQLNRFVGMLVEPDARAVCLRTG